jgi:signal transduction histidine kinase
VSGDPVLLAQALSNLIDNALKYAPVNGTMQVAVQKRDEAGVEVSVTDDGPGISDSEKGKVGERFYRGDASRGTPGVGLGLSLVQAVAKLHGSALTLSDQNPGLRVALVLQLDAPNSTAAEMAAPSPTGPARINGGLTPAVELPHYPQRSS